VVAEDQGLDGVRGQGGMSGSEDGGKLARGDATAVVEGGEEVK
jgi:hypothetical protein